LKKISVCEDNQQLSDLQQRPTAKTSSSSVKSDPKKLVIIPEIIVKENIVSFPEIIFRKF